MERDIFKGAQFGDRFKTNDERIAIYHKSEIHKNELWHYLIIEPKDVEYPEGNFFTYAPYAAYVSKNGKGYPEHLKAYEIEDDSSPNFGSLITEKLTDTIWVARNKDGSYAFAENEVSLARINEKGRFVDTAEEGVAWYDCTGMHDVPYLHTCKNYFPNLKWEDDPVKVELRALYQNN